MDQGLTTPSSELPPGAPGRQWPTMRGRQLAVAVQGEGPASWTVGRREVSSQRPMVIITTSRVTPVRAVVKHLPRRISVHLPGSVRGVHWLAAGADQTPDVRASGLFRAWLRLGARAQGYRAETRPSRGSSMRDVVDRATRATAPASRSMRSALRVVETANETE